MKKLRSVFAGALLSALTVWSVLLRPRKTGDTRKVSADYSSITHFG